MKNKALIIIILIVIVVGVAIFFLINNSSNKTVNTTQKEESYEGQNNIETLEKVAKESLGQIVDVKIGEYEEIQDESGFRNTVLKTTITNLQEMPQSFNIEIAAFKNEDGKEELIRTDTKSIDNIEPKQELEVNFFDNITLTEQEKLKNASFRVVNIENIWFMVEEGQQ